MNDLISRAAAIEALERMLNYCEEIDGHLPEDERTGYKMFPDYELIYEYLRGSTAERVGKWERKWHTFFRAELYYCSACGYYEAFERNFCPNCGARMEGEEDETDRR